jgi:hypothetical protein
LVRAARGRPRAARTRPRWPWLLLAAALLVGGLLWWAPGTTPAAPPDQLLGTQPSPTGAVANGIETLPFRWQLADLQAGEKYVLYLYGDDLLTPFAQFDSDTRAWLLERGVVARMRTLRADWRWRVERVRVGQPGAPDAVVEATATFGFSFVQ